ncbi:SchA/CurD-like domain-containing protein [Amycolatopsis aidingensis]|uniref:SchA/CurD-like domain-containing protein n=1 Tax=Amycolatopsis aidingensis TaxID=2842453 RepID=UPI001C0D3547|nr:SchA/CurD-like domain-containing protein [Amycolatopsis aidingensis]
MPYAAITYDVQPGYEDEIEQIFADFKRVSTPVIRNAEGEVTGRLLGSAVFIKDDIMVRVIHYEGSLVDVGRHMGQQQGVHELESKLAPYLAKKRDTKTPEAFQQHFRNSLMRSIAQLTPENYPGSATTSAG